VISAATVCRLFAVKPTEGRPPELVVPHTSWALEDYEHQTGICAYVLVSSQSDSCFESIRFGRLALVARVQLSFPSKVTPLSSCASVEPGGRSLEEARRLEP
jgi:hypothetical protein